MTGGEMERAIEFLLQSQANFDSRIGGLTGRMETLTQNVEENTRQIAQINKQIEVLAGSQNNLTQIVIRLADTVERFIIGGGDGHERR